MDGYVSAKGWLYNQKRQTSGERDSPEVDKSELWELPRPHAHLRLQKYFFSCIFLENLEKIGKTK